MREADTEGRDWVVSLRLVWRWNGDNFGAKGKIIANYKYSFSSALAQSAAEAPAPQGENASPVYVPPGEESKQDDDDEYPARA